MVRLGLDCRRCSGGWGEEGWGFVVCWCVFLVDFRTLKAFDNSHQVGSRNTETSMLMPIPTAHTRPRLAMPGLLENASDPKPATAVPPQSISARPTERRTATRSPA